MFATDSGWHDGQPLDGQDGDGQEYDIEPAFRTSDARQAKSGLKGARSDQWTQAEREAHKQELDRIPKCDTCSGRHRCHPCPNGVARSQKDPKLAVVPPRRASSMIKQ